METLTVKNAAKINLALDVTGKLPNGYHTIESIFQTIGIYDETTVSINNSNKIVLTCEAPDTFVMSDKIPCDERNTAYKAAKIFMDSTGIRCGCAIHIKKNIPSQAGLGGGSSDAAAVLYLLNRLTKVNMDKKQLELLGKEIGADVPYFLTGGTAYVSGIGEKIVSIKNISNLYLTIAKGSDGVSTAEAYKNIDKMGDFKHLDIISFAECVKSDKLFFRYFGNIFEYVVNLESIKEIKHIMYKYSAISALMTGTGSAVFGVFSNINAAQKCAESLISKGFFAASCQAVPYSFVLIDE